MTGTWVNMLVAPTTAAWMERVASGMSGPVTKCGHAFLTSIKFDMRQAA
jgi:hypothetical protein